jgi:serine/threonine-protein kinase
VSATARLSLVLALALLGAALSGLLLLDHHGQPLGAGAVDGLCGEGEQSGCAVVARSAWSRVGGIPVAALGLLFYLSLALGSGLALIGPPELRAPAARWAFLGTAAAAAVDLGLLAIQAFAIRAFCALCVWTYAVTLGALVLLWPFRRRAAEPPPAPAARLATGGWAIGTLALALAVLAADRALAYREQRVKESLLGAAIPPLSAPAPQVTALAGTASAPPPTTTAPAPSGSAADVQGLSEQLRLAQQEARRLQDILDDPQKLDQYFAAKAAREFETAPVQPLKLEGVPFKGPADAPVKVVEFSDFLCPYCRSLAGAFAGFLPQSANKVAVYFKNYPLDQACNPHVKATVHAGACELAQAAICAHDQGRFWQYHDKVFSSKLGESVSRADAVRLAGEAGLDTVALEACMGAPQTRERLLAEMEEASRGGLKGTPTVFINGRLLPRINDFIDAVNKELVRLGHPPLAMPQSR